MQKVVVYKDHNYINDSKHLQLIEGGWRVVAEEETKEFNPSKGCCLLVLFFPLVLFARSNRVRVTYEFTAK